MALAAEQRAAQRALARLLERDVNGTWHLIDDTRLKATLPQWTDVMTALIHQYGKASAVTAGRFYLAERAAQGVKGRFAVPPPSLPPAEQTRASLGYAVSGLYGADTDRAAVRTITAGVAQRLVTNVGRQTVIDSIRSDRHASGWRRFAAPDSCDFCLMLTDRGAVYSAATADFAAHDHCSCVAEPSFGGSVHVRDYTPTAHNVTDTERERLRSYLRENYRR